MSVTSLRRWQLRPRETPSAIEWVDEGRLLTDARRPSHWKDMANYPAGADDWVVPCGALARAAAVINRFLAAPPLRPGGISGNGLRPTVAKLQPRSRVARRAAAQRRERAMPLSSDTLLHAIRQPDLLLIHLTERDALARAWSS